MVLFPGCSCCGGPCAIESDGNGSEFVDNFDYTTDAELTAGGWLASCYALGYGPYNYQHNRQTFNARCSFFDASKNGTIEIRLTSIAGGQQFAGITIGNDVTTASPDCPRLFEFGRVTPLLIDRYIVSFVSYQRDFFAQTDSERYQIMWTESDFVRNDSETLTPQGTYETKLVARHADGNWYASLFFNGLQRVAETYIPNFYLTENKFLHGMSTTLQTFSYGMKITYT